jgi:hypothetical protein
MTTKITTIMGSAAAVIALSVSMALAGPTAQINIPSTDTKGLKEVTLSISNNVRFSSASDAGPNLYDIGVVTGLLPFEKVKIEIGVDYGTIGATSQPITYNAKLATAEDALFAGLPAFAVGGFNLGSVNAHSNAQNIAYALAAKTLPVVGRLSVGGYCGDKNAAGMEKNSGVLASWDRTITEISDKLWLGIDYMSGNNADGEISFGGSWAFSKQINLLAGVVFYNKTAVAGKAVFTTQLSINLP